MVSIYINRSEYVPLQVVSIMIMCCSLRKAHNIIWQILRKPNMDKLRFWCGVSITIVPWEGITVVVRGQTWGQPCCRNRKGHASRQIDRKADRQEASRANPSSRYLYRPAQPISSEMGAQQLSIGHWSGLGLTAFPLWRLEETGRRLQEKQEGRKTGEKWRWYRRGKGEK